MNDQSLEDRHPEIPTKLHLKSDDELRAIGDDRSLPLTIRTTADHILFRREAEQRASNISPEEYSEILCKIKKGITIAPGELLRSALALPRPRRK